MRNNYDVSSPCSGLKMSLREDRFFCPSVLGPCGCDLAVELLHNPILLQDLNRILVNTREQTFLSAPRCLFRLYTSFPIPQWDHVKSLTPSRRPSRDTLMTFDHHQSDSEENYSTSLFKLP